MPVVRGTRMNEKKKENPEERCAAQRKATRTALRLSRKSGKRSCWELRARVSVAPSFHDFVVFFLACTFPS